MKTILIIDDDKDFRTLTKRQLEKNGFRCLESGTATRAFELLSTEGIELVLCDLHLRKENAVELLARMVDSFPAIPVIIVTAYPNVRNTVDFMRSGAVDYLMKPLNTKELIAAIAQRIEDYVPAPVKRNAATAPLQDDYVFSDGEFVQKALAQIRIVSPTNYSVIIYGESGSGKEAFAREIHKQSSRSSKAFLALDCGALSKDLAASTLFGHVKGAFTGAIADKAGVFEAAKGGTVFLDEIANLAYEVQVSLLRMTQERVIRRVGDTREISVDVRLIVASNTRLWNRNVKGNFREDLYHRLNEFSLDIAPLRERQDDIRFYAELFLSQANHELGKNLTGLSPEAIEALRQYGWPGNLRELRNVIKRTALSAKSTVIRREDIEWCFMEPVKPIHDPLQFSGTNEAKNMIRADSFLRAMELTGFNKRKAGRLLGMDAKTVERIIR